jgi:hypothetical protein
MVETWEWRNHSNKEEAVTLVPNPDEIVELLDAVDGDVLRRTHDGHRTVYIVHRGKLVEITSRKVRS